MDEKCTYMYENIFSVTNSYYHLNLNCISLSAVKNVAFCVE